MVHLLNGGHFVCGGGKAKGQTVLFVVFFLIARHTGFDYFIFIRI